MASLEKTHAASRPSLPAQCLAVLAVSAALVMLDGRPVSADTYGSSQRTAAIDLNSEALGEAREIFVRTPPKYDPSRRYPVVYVLDGEWSFEYVASYLDYMFDNDVYPEMIVTGVRNVNRNRDYVPRADDHFDDTGEADTFLAFVKDDWIPAIGARYSASDERTLLGHSFGGVFTMHTLFSEPALFDAYIALGTSAWISNGVLLEEARAYFADPRDADAFVYMAVGEGDGGPTVPSSKELAALFEESAPPTLDWTFDVTPKTDHFKNFASGMHDAFMALYPAWEFEDEVLELGRKEGASGVTQWFEDKRKTLGVRFLPAWFDLGVAGLTLAREGHGEAARALLDHLMPYHPENAYVASFSANVFEMTGRHREALREYERALAIVERDGLHPNAMHRDRLERGVKRVSDQLGTEGE